MEIVKFKAEHMKAIIEQEAQRYLQKYITEENAILMEKQKLSFTMLVDGKPIACGGICEYWPGRGEIWVILDQHCKRQFLKIHNAAKRLIAMSGIKRIEAVVDYHFDAAHRWMDLLGFKLEAPCLQAYRPDGGDCSLYVMVK